MPRTLLQKAGSSGAEGVYRGARRSASLFKENAASGPRSSPGLPGALPRPSPHPGVNMVYLGSGDSRDPGTGATTMASQLQRSGPRPRAEFTAM